MNTFVLISHKFISEEDSWKKKNGLHDEKSEPSTDGNYVSTVS